jgi:uncharacterized protein YndB with AHSA1/START domain
VTAPEPADAVQAAQPAAKTLPFSGSWPLLAGVMAGIALRLVFSGQPGGPYAAMSASFIYLGPCLVGAVTVYVAERQQRRSWGYYLWAPYVANLLFVLGTLLVLIEGLICAIVIVPLFACLGAVGGLAMGAVCRVTNWPRPMLYSLWVLPLLAGAIEPSFSVPEQLRQVERRITIAAPPERVWNEIHAARDIQAAEVEGAWFFRIGVPLPREGVTRLAGAERVRTITMGKNIHFDQVEVERIEQRHVRWRHRYAADSFSPHALDEHVTLGGHYFDIGSTAYTLRPVPEGTELQVIMDYRVSTRFNWYADPVARWLVGNFEGILLDFYRRRSER